MRAPQVVTSLAAGDPDGLAALADAVSLAGWPRDLGQFFAGLPDPKKGRRTRGEALPVTGNATRGEQADAGRHGAAGDSVSGPRTSELDASGPGASELDASGPGASGASAHRDSAGRDSARAEGEPAELRILFEDAAAGLKLDEREVIELQLRQGLAAGEVATVLGVSGKHARALLSRARTDLESCLGVLLVGRAGRAECGELATLLNGWDGRLTAVLRKRVQRHIEHCATCTARRALELRPARLRNLPPAAALAAGAAESFRLALGAPAALRAHTIALALGRGPGAAAHSTAVLARAGAFGGRGFPRPARGTLAGRRGTGRLRARLLAGRQGRAELAAVAVLAVATAVACALAGGSAHRGSARPGPAGNPRPPASAHVAGPPAALPAPAGAISGPASASPVFPRLSGPNGLRPGARTAPVWASGTPGQVTPGSALPGTAGGRTAAGSPSTNPYRQLRSWDEQNRLR